jgi:hypothetical protein
MNSELEHFKNTMIAFVMAHGFQAPARRAPPIPLGWLTGCRDRGNFAARQAG